MDESRDTGYTPEEPVTPADSEDTAPATPVPPENITEEPATGAAEVYEEEMTEVSEAETADAAPEIPADMPPFTPPYTPASAHTADAEEGGAADPDRESAHHVPPQGAVPPHLAHDASEGHRMPPPPPPHMHPGQGFSHSGEYRYAPPYSDPNARDRVYPAAPSAHSAPGGEPEDKSKNKKEKKVKVKTVRTFSTTALVFILIGAVLLSFASGMLGALLVEGGLGIADSEGESVNETENNDGDNSDLVINKADEDDDSDGSSQDQLTGSHDISDVCAYVSASVVEITTEFTKTYYGYYQYVQEGAGSGVIISSDGYIITNAHVITDSESGSLADAIKIRLNSGDEYEASIIGSDSDSDIALLKVNAKNLSAATVGNSDTIKVGEQVIAVGNPLGELGGTVTSGIVSATNRDITVENNKMTLIQIDAAINPGNSGGGLFNTDGELIGIVNAKTTDVTVEGLGFAIPVNEAVGVAEELESHGYVTGKTHIGISLTDVTDSFTAYYYFRSESTGVYVTSVQEGYNEDVLKYGDRITAIDDREITSSSDVKEIVQESKVGDKLIFTISRDGKLKDVEVTCYEYVPEENVSFDGE